jgi:hypothetical protein
MLANHTSIASVRLVLTLAGQESGMLKYIFSVNQTYVGPIRSSQEAKRVLGAIQEGEDV